MFTILMIILIIISILLMIVILMQSSKGSGLSGAFGGAGGVGTMFGVRRAADFLSRSSWVLAVTFTVICIAMNVWFLPTAATEESIIRRSADEQPLAPVPQQSPVQQQQGTPAQTGQGQQQQTQQPQGQNQQKAPAQQP